MAPDQPASKPTAAEIGAQLARILESRLFALSYRQKAFLTYVINAEVEGRGHTLKEFTLGIDVFEKDESFDPGIDSIVRVEASRLRSKLKEYYSGEGRSDPVRIDIPKGHYVPVFSLTGQGIGQKKSTQVQAVDGRGPSKQRFVYKLGFAALGLMAAVIFYFVLNDHLFEPSSLATDNDVHNKSIAVLPFVSLSSGEDDGYFADGLTEEILNSLAQLPELKVTARTSSFFFKGQNLRVPDIASRLNVAHVVEGSVRRDGNRLRIAAQLIRASDDFHLWSQAYDRTRDDVFAVQQNIAENIAEVLGVVLDDASREVMHSAGIQDVEAFIAYQKGHEAWVTAHQGIMNMADALVVANTHFDHALEATPGLTMARLMKADLRAHIVFDIAADFRDETHPGEYQDALAALREEYDLAVRLSPSGKQRDILNVERMLFGGEWTGLAFRMDKAVQPGGCPQMNWTSLMASFGWADQLVTKLREAINCNPMDTNASFQLAWSLIWSGESDAALRAITEAENKGLSHPSLDDGRYWAMLATGRSGDQVARISGAGMSRMTYDPQILREALAGDLAVARRMADNYWSEPKRDDLSSLVLAAVVGDREKANEVANRIDAYPGSAVVISTAVFLCFCGAPFDLQATPNYQARIEEAGFPWPPPKHIDYPAKTW